MQPNLTLRQDLVLVGGGHAHALVLRMLAMQPLAGLRISLVSPASHTPYSGMLPGLLAGHYRFEETHIDLARLCQWAGVRFIAAEVEALDPERRQLTLRGRPALSYDVVSLDIGCVPELDSVPGAREHATPVKPVAGLWQRWQALLERHSAVRESPLRVAVVGGGAGSVELALAIAHRLGARARLALYCGADDILQGYNRGARRAVKDALDAAGISLALSARVQRVEAGRLYFTAADAASFDELFWCTGAAAAPWLGASGLATDDAGFLAVRDTLQSLDDERLFAAGDCATQMRHPRPKAGVYAVRQGPVLAHNLRNFLLQRPLREHRPQRRFLSLVSLGERRAAADRGPWAASGAWVWRWKDRIDRAFMQRFVDLPSRMKPAQPLPQADPPHPFCGGCGAKVGADTLSAVLQRLTRDFPRHCRPQDLGDDCAPLPSRAGAPLWQSIDVLRALVADPWLMGRIAANHALSDLYACGARPLSALATVTLPFAREALLERELEQLLAGALLQFVEADCRLTGGHSLQGSEFSIGFVVNGETAQLLPKRGPAAGDRLLLSKALGTGVLFAAQMQLRADGRHIDAAIDMMLRSNASAAALAQQAQASACTDVTGFGLGGHLLEMLSSDQAAMLQLESLPVLPGAMQALAAGIRSSMHEANERAVGERLAEIAAAPARRDLMLDPQTSGGLLIAVPPERAQVLCDQLRQAGDADAALIGTVVEREGAAAPQLLTE